MAFCTVCGTRSEENADFCGNCGSKTQTTSQQPGSPPSEKQTQYYPPQEYQQSKAMDSASSRGMVQGSSMGMGVPLLISLFLPGLGMILIGDRHSKTYKYSIRGVVIFILTFFLLSVPVLSFIGWMTGLVLTYMAVKEYNQTKLEGAYAHSG